MGAAEGGPRRALVGIAAIAVLALALVFAAVATTAAEARPFAPLDAPAPKLRVERDLLRASLECSDGVRDADRAPVLLVPATGVNSDQNFSWNYEPLFRAQGIPFCTSDQQGERNINLLDIQTRGDYLAYAIRRMHAMAGRRISILGHSQGGMAMRWPLRFWPETRRMVDDVIGFAGTNNGTTQANECRGTDECSPAAAQQAANSEFIRALNSRARSFAGISYTEVHTTLDQVVTPPREAASLDGPGEVTNVAIQDVCPLALSDHLAIGTTDPAAAALALDALTHDGPADPERVDPLVCLQPVQPGVDPIAAPPQILAALNNLFLAAGPSGGEPSLRCYVFKNRSGCRAARAGR